MGSARHGIDRRTFLRLGAVASGVVVGCRDGGQTDSGGSTPVAMRTRPLGATGLEVSEITFGAHGVDDEALMQAALDAGINTFFTSGSYLDGREEASVGSALASFGGRKDRIVVITGEEILPGATKNWILDRIDASLRRLRRDHIEVYCTFQVSSPAQLRVDALFEAFETARAAGKVGHLGMSGHHGSMQACLEAAIDGGRVEAFFIKHDFASYPELAGTLHRAAERGIGTVVFKTDAGHREREIKDLEAGGLSFRQATLRWALASPDVASVAVTMTSFQKIREAVAAAGAPLSAAEAEMLRRYAEVMGDRYCRFCATCEAACPHGVAVADVNRYDMYFSYYGREKEAMGRYAALPATRSAAACAGCDGRCDAVCPFGRQVRAELVAAHARLRAAEALG